MNETHSREFIISFEANSKRRDVLASFKAALLALLKDAAVPTGDFGSALRPVGTEIFSYCHIFKI